MLHDRGYDGEVAGVRRAERWPGPQTAGTQAVGRRSAHTEHAEQLELVQLELGS